LTKTIGILTSGGDCPGLNAAIRAAAHAAAGRGWRVFGIANGTEGLMTRPPSAQVLNPASLDKSVLRESGTILGTTNRGDPFAYPMPDGTKKDRSEEIIEGYRMLGLDALIVIGGDGSLRILKQLADQGGLNIVAVPKTIDNDVGLTEVSIGFDTAMRVAAGALDSLQPTAASHHRVMVLEVMGRDAGHIALAAGIAGGADVILVPEIRYRLKAIAAKFAALRQNGRNFGLVVVAEGVHTEDGKPVTITQPSGRETYGGIGNHLARRIAETTGAEIRVTVLGHLQRGAPPSARDRLIATTFGVHAVDLIARKRFGHMVAWQQRDVVEVTIDDALAAHQLVDPKGALVRTARGLGGAVGDEKA
jgi:phosphofructokinase-like protein